MPVRVIILPARLADRDRDMPGMAALQACLVCQAGRGIFERHFWHSLPPAKTHAHGCILPPLGLGGGTVSRHHSIMPVLGGDILDILPFLVP